MTEVLKFILFLLKCLGILLLVIVGLLLLVTVLLLLVPVRYRGRIDKKEAPEEVFRADGLISWLNPFLRVRIRYTEKKLHYTVRMFGLCLRNSDKPKKEKKQKKKEKIEKIEKKEQTSGKDPEKTGTAAETIERDKPVSGRVVVTEPVPGTVSDGSEEPVPEETPEIPEESGKKEKRPSLFAKIKNLYEKIKGIPTTIKQKVIKAINTIKLLWKKKEKTIAFFEDELHKTALGTTWTTVKQVLRHVLPGKIKGHVEFGTGDPASTGKALGVLGVLYAWYGKGVTIVPDFYEKRVEAELELKGRIRFGTLLVKGLRLMRDKQVKRFREDFKKLLKVLKQKAE